MGGLGGGQWEQGRSAEVDLELTSGGVKRGTEYSVHPELWEEEVTEGALCVDMPVCRSPLPPFRAEGRRGRA